MRSARPVLSAFLAAAVAVMPLASPAAAHTPSILDLNGAVRAGRQTADLQAVVIYRAGLARLVAYARTRGDLFPSDVPAPRLLTEVERGEVRSLWRSFLDYALALESLERFHAAALPGTRSFAPSFQVARGAFSAQYRFGLELIQLAANDPKLAILLNDPVPEVGLPGGTYDQFKLRFLNVAAASQFAAYEALARTLPAPADPRFAKAMAEDATRIWQLGQGTGEALTAVNAANVLKKLGSRVTFPVQAGIAEWMGDTRVRRQGQALISPSQVAALRPGLLPGDVLLERREWFMSNVGLPGFWSHAALYVGTPGERRAYFDDADVRRWVASQGEGSGDLERLLARLYPRAHALALAPQEHGHLPRVLEAISEGVVFTTLEHSAAADSLAVLRPRLPKVEKAQALVRGFRYMGRPYDFNFDFQTDSALVCTELIYKSYEPAPGLQGLRLRLDEIAGRTAIPANAIARQFDEDQGTAPQLDLVLFLDGQERRGIAIRADATEFRKSWRRPKWHVLVQPENPLQGSH
jgi:permuted papain-like amidase YaeF/Yiix C92 family enzyme